MKINLIIFLLATILFFQLIDVYVDIDTLKQLSLYDIDKTQ